MKTIYDIKSLTKDFVEKNNAVFLYSLQGRFGQVGSVLEINERKYLLFYKKRWFETFSKFFPKFNCVGIGLTMKHIELADLTDGIIVYFIVDKEYRIQGKLVKEFVEKNNTRRFYEEDQVTLGIISATFLERNMIVKQRINRP